MFFFGGFVFGLAAHGVCGDSGEGRERGKHAIRVVEGRVQKTAKKNLEYPVADPEAARCCRGEVDLETTRIEAGGKFEFNPRWV